MAAQSAPGNEGGRGGNGPEARRKEERKERERKKEAGSRKLRAKDGESEKNEANREGEREENVAMEEGKGGKWRRRMAATPSMKSWKLRCGQERRTETRSSAICPKPTMTRAK